MEVARRCKVVANQVASVFMQPGGHEWLSSVSHAVPPNAFGWLAIEQVSSVPTLRRAVSAHHSQRGLLRLKGEELLTIKESPVGNLLRYR